MDVCEEGEVREWRGEGRVGRDEEGTGSRWEGGREGDGFGANVRQEAVRS